MAKESNIKKDEVKETQTDEAQGDEAEAGQGIVRRLNPKDVIGGNIRDLVMDGKIKLPGDLYTLIGRANNIREGESAFGPWTELRGEFEATNIAADSPAYGQKFISTACFVPGPAGDLLVQQVRSFVTEPIAVTEEQFKKTGRTYRVTGEYVEMALIIGAKKAERPGGAPYEFTVRPVVAVQKADSLASMRAKITAYLPRLPAPAK